MPPSDPIAGRSAREAASVALAASCELPTRWANFQLHLFHEPATGKEHIALTLGDIGDGRPVLARVHSECLTGDTLFSLRCDCGAQLESALGRIAAAGRGMLLYLRQEGRGIGLTNKIRAYALQESGSDTVDANLRLGFPEDLRTYSVCGPMLRHFGVSALDLMTNNPLKLAALRELGITVRREEIVTAVTPFNAGYLDTKVRKMGHLSTGLPVHAADPGSETDS